MKRQISKEQYVLIDIIILTLILCALEWASRMALNIFPREMAAITIVLPVTLIAMMRHGIGGVSLAAIGGLVYCMINGASWDVYLVYIIGNCFIILNLFWFKKLGKEKVRQNTGLIIMYVISGYILMNLGRSVLALILGYRSFFSTMVRYFTTDALSGVMSVIIVLIARRQDGVFEDQMGYLQRIAAEEEQKNGSKA